MSILTGCMYPRENMKQSAIPYEDQLQVYKKPLIHIRSKRMVYYQLRRVI